MIREEVLKKYPYNKIPPYFFEEYEIEEDMQYTVETVPARSLLTPGRIDLMAKWYYIDAFVKGQDMTFARDIYRKHLYAFSGGTFTEPGSEEKNSFEKYVDAFEALIRDIQENGFDSEKSLVLTGANNVILDGSHRVSVAAYFDREVTILRYNSLKQDFGPAFFSERGLEAEIIDYLVLKYCELTKGLYVSCLWPRAKDKERRQEAIEILKKDAETVYVRDYYLSAAAQKNFMQQIYSHHDWVGTAEDHHAGAEYKSNECYAGGGHLTVVFFHQNDLEQVIAKKQAVRDLFAVENHSIHITDSDRETRQIAELLLNRNTRSHLFHGQPDTYPSFHRMVRAYTESVKQHGMDLSDYVADTSSILAVYGIRDAGDVDYLTKVPEVSLENELYENHPSLYPISVESIIDQPLYYFHYMGVKYVAPYMLYRMKLIRGSEKDPADCASLRKLLKKGKIYRKRESSLSKWQKALIDTVWDAKE